MQIGLIGLGRMGANIARRLMARGHSVLAYDQTPATLDALARNGGMPAASIEDLIGRLTPPRIVWVMLPAGDATETAILRLGELLKAGDIVIDGGNTFWRDDIRRAKALKLRGLHHLDVGTSGGLLGAEHGYCLMIGGESAVVPRLEPIFAALAPGGETRGSSATQGWLHVGPNGAGHFVKMVHNGIEYAMMQAYAEGFQILKETDSVALPEAERFALNIGDIAELWRHGSIVASTLLDVTASALGKDAALQDFSGVVDDTGEGRWTVQVAIERAIPAMALTTALNARFRSRRAPNFADKIISAMRRGFGGHIEKRGGP
jgi:6-phosphogluconate dehydrogenase